jgi:hypothetical protein
MNEMVRQDAEYNALPITITKWSLSLRVRFIFLFLGPGLVTFFKMAATKLAYLAKHTFEK